jgi:cytochrome c-type biogenesis protein CcmH
VARAAEADKPTYDSIASKVMCVCGGCVAPLSQCPHIDCGTKAEMQAYIKQELAAGKSEAAILQDFSARYGVSVLTAPPAKGFNLTVWTLPGIGLLVGLAGVVVIVRRWRSRPAPEAAVPSVPTDPQTLAAVEEEMKSAKLG